MKKQAFTSLVRPALFLVCAGSAAGENNTPTVATNQTDYRPGSTVCISGYGFQPGETVQLQVPRIDIPENDGPEHQPWQVTADSNGNFQTRWDVTFDEVGATLQLTATGLTSGLTAQRMFTDDANMTVSGKVRLAGGTGAQGATLTGCKDSGLTQVDGSTTSASDGTWTLTSAKNTTRYVVVSPPAGCQSTDAVAGTGANATRISATELSFSTTSNGGSSSGNQFVVVAAATRLVTTLPGQTFTSGSGNSGTVSGQTGGDVVQHHANGSGHKQCHRHDALGLVPEKSRGYSAEGH